MADQYTPLPVKTKTAGDVVTNINNGTVTLVSSFAAGTQNTLGTVGTVLGAGTLSNVGSLTNAGTVKEITNIVGGTIGSIIGVGGTVQVSGASAGTYVNISTGTQQTLGTVGVVNSIVAGTQNTLGTVGVVNNIVTGTIAAVASGTITGGTLGNLVSGTVTSVGTAVGLGTVTNLGSVTNAGTVKEISNIAGGTVTVSNYPGASSPKFSYQTSAALAAAALATISFTAITNAKTGQLQSVLMSSSVPIRGEVQRIEDTGGTIGTAGVVFSSAANPTVYWNAPTDTYFTQVSTGTAKFRAVITNMDNALAADVYATAFWDEI